MGIAEVILVDEQDNEIGVMEKMDVHRQGLLHRAFSVFIFNSTGHMLLQKRASCKYHSPGLWTNACCSHPAPGETTSFAAARRLNEELGFTCFLSEITSFIYETPFDNGLIEHEYDHVFTGIYEGEITLNDEEVEEIKWMSLKEIDEAISENRDQFSFWFLIAYPLVKQKLISSQN